MWQQKNSLPCSKPHIAAWTNWKANLRTNSVDTSQKILTTESTFVILLVRISAKIKEDLGMNNQYETTAAAIRQVEDALKVLNDFTESQYKAKR